MRRGPAAALGIVAVAVAVGLAAGLVMVVAVGGAGDAGAWPARGAAARAVAPRPAGDGDLLAQVGGAPARVRLMDRRAYVAQGPRVVIVDVTDPDAPRVTGRSALLSAVLGDLAVTSASGGGALLWAVGAPRDPDETVLVALTVGADSEVVVLSETRVTGRYGRVAAGAGGVWLGGEDVVEIDSSDPARPAVAGRTAVPGDTGVAQLEVVGRRLVALVQADATHDLPPSLRLWNIAPGAALANAGSLEQPEGSRWRMAVAAAAPYVWLVDGAQLVAVDVAGPAAPLVASATEVGNGLFAPAPIAADGRHVYVATHWGFCPRSGALVADVQGATVLGVREAGDRLGIDHAVAAGASEGVALVASWDGTLTALRADLDPPAWAGRVAGIGSAGAVAAGDATVFVAAADGMAIVNAHDPAQPRVVGQTASSRYVTDFAVRRGVVFAADDGDCDVLGAGLALVDVGDPASPTELWHVWLHGWGSSIALADEGLVVGVANVGGGSSISVRDVADASVALGETSLGGRLTDVAISGRTAVAALAPDWRQEGVLEVAVADASDPAARLSFARLGLGIAVDSSEEVRARVAMDDSFAYVAYSVGRGPAFGAQGLAVVDVGDVTAPRLVTRMDVPGPSSVALGHGRLYIGTPTGVAVVDVSDPLQPVAEGTLGTVRPVEAVAVADGVVYATAGSGGLYLFDAPGEPPPPTPKVTPTATATPEATPTPGPHPGPIFLPLLGMEERLRANNVRGEVDAGASRADGLASGLYTAPSKP